MSYYQVVGRCKLLQSAGVMLCLSVVAVQAQPAAPARGREFAPGVLKKLEDLPQGNLRNKLDKLPPNAKARGLQWLQSFHFTEDDLPSLDADAEGGIFYTDEFTLEGAVAAEPMEPVVAAAAVPVDPFPSSLVFHSKPGAPNVIYLNFGGELVTDTVWNTSLGRTEVPALPFSTDTDTTTFSDAEQLAIRRVWQRVAEDYAPFNVDVTTERPATFTARTAHALITRSTDATGAANPSSSAGGVAYVNVFAGSSYARYRPAWIYYNNLSGNESYIAEATSHEIGHNLGLSHDGKTDGAGYYGGHGSGDTSWGPIMGTGYGRSVSQWSKGEYYLANNTQDDLATISGYLPYRTDDHGDSSGAATALVISGGTNLVATTPETDPTNTKPANKGVLERNTDVDVFSFATGTGPINIIINPWTMASGTKGGNVDLLVELRDSSGNVLQTSNPTGGTAAQIQASLSQGTYYLFIRNTGVGDPLSATPSGYTSYGSIGQYFISGYVAPSTATAQTVQLTATVNNAAWGTVTPSSGSYALGSSAQLVATPKPFYRFLGWTNGASGTNDPLTLVLNTNTIVQAVFGELFTTNNATPLSWLASYGYTNNFETAVNLRGSNGVPLWQSYIAGLNPKDATSQLRLSMSRPASGTSNVINWNTVTGRVYTLWYSTNLTTGYKPVSGASNLASTVKTFTHTLNPAPKAVYYRIEVKMQ